MTGRNEEWIGRLLDDRYRIVEVLGEGGQGVVYLAHDELLGKGVVVKRPLLDGAFDADQFDRFYEEIKYLQDLDHNHIVDIRSKGQIDNCPYLILKFIRGGSLKDRLLASGGRLEQAEVDEWLKPIASALDYLHGKNIIHRDVKPGNILFDAQRAAFLADFGIAKALDSAQLAAKTRGTIGTGPYMAPEAVHQAYTPAYDQYALATVVFECLAGRRPYDDRIDFLKKATEAPRPLRKLAPIVSSGIEECVLRGLQADPGKRFETCGELSRAFSREFQRTASETTRRINPEKEPPEKEPPEKIASKRQADKEPDKRRKRRKRVLYASAGALAGVSIIGVALLWFFWIPVDIDVTTKPVGARIEYQGKQVTTPATLHDLKRALSYAVTISKPGYEPQQIVLDPSGERARSYKLTPDCKGTPTPGTSFPVRVLFEGVDVENELRILSRFANVSAVGMGCDATATLRAGSTTQLLDREDRVMFDSLESLEATGVELLRDAFESLVLEELLLGPHGDSSIDLRVSASIPPAGQDPRPAARFLRDSRGYFYALSTSLRHVLVVVVQSGGKIALLHPKDAEFSNDLIEPGRWRELDRGHFSTVGRDTAIAFASDDSWKPFLESLGMPRPNALLDLPVLSDETTPTARDAAEALSKRLSDSTSWARDSQTYVVDSPPN